MTYRLGLFLALALSAGPLAADDLSLATNVTVASPERGPETNLPLPRYVSLKASEANVRRGPSLSHRIDWVFQRRSMPLRVVAEYGHWRRVIDKEGQGGWVHYTMLSGARNVIMLEDVMIRKRPDETSVETAQLESGVVARLGECGPEWCKISVAGYKGWAQKPTMWGVAPDEVRE